MTDLTMRLLAEIERREAEHRSTMPMRDIVDRHRDEEPLAYLAALRAIVEIHHAPHQCHDREGTVTIVRDECDTLLAVAEALGVDLA